MSGEHCDGPFYHVSLIGSPVGDHIGHDPTGAIARPHARAAASLSILPYMKHERAFLGSDQVFPR
jgi:hypothetical protein